ncbi:hypothetical protein Shyhy02_14710 [Streptomyces hygroscopicus subsp. hygroscopicus]|nr:hypothetical protein Shyhy02_14710 [Streptomyces hygroscopicus subsp. hygroscopicus]
MGQRIGHVEQVGAGHQLLPDPLLHPREQCADPVEVALQGVRFEAPGPAGVQQRERQVMADMGVDPGQRKSMEHAPHHKQAPPGTTGSARTGRVWG